MYGERWAGQCRCCRISGSSNTRSLTIVQQAVHHFTLHIATCRFELGQSGLVFIGPLHGSEYDLCRHCMLSHLEKGYETFNDNAHCLIAQQKSERLRKQNEGHVAKRRSNKVGTICRGSREEQAEFPLWVSL
jgi:hypothetical protein